MNKIVVEILVFFLIIGTIISPSINGNIVEKSFFVKKIEINDDNFDQQIKEYMITGHLPSLALAIIKNNRLVWSKGYGYADIYHKTEANNKTVYMLASISKTFTATAIMQLWEKGLLELDIDVNTYLPFTVRNPNYPDVPITIRMLLTHRSSISSRIINLYTTFSLFRFPYDDLGEYLNPGGKLYSAKNWNNFPPGEKQSYSCIAYELLGYVIECITNQSFPDYCSKNIFEPLNMKNTSYHPSDYKKEQLAVQYVYLLRWYIPLPEFEDRNYASGGLRSNIEDLSHYLIAYMNRGEYKGVRILKNDTIDLIFTEQFPSDYFISYGLGWQIYSDHNHSEKNLRIGHNGGMPGSQTYMFYHVSKNIGIIIFANQHLTYTIDTLMSWFSIIDLLVDKSNEFI